MCSYLVQVPCIKIWIVLLTKIYKKTWGGRRVAVCLYIYKQRVPNRKWPRAMNIPININADRRGKTSLQIFHTRTPWQGWKINNPRFLDSFPHPSSPWLSPTRKSLCSHGATRRQKRIKTMWVLLAGQHEQHSSTLRLVIRSRANGSFIIWEWRFRLLLANATPRWRHRTQFYSWIKQMRCSLTLKNWRNEILIDNLKFVGINC